MTRLYPVYKFAAGHWHQPQFIFYATTDRRALDFACAYNRAQRAANPASNGCYLAPSIERGDEPNVNNYRGWNIDFEYGYHTAVHDDYDASWEGEEDGWVDNGLRLSERTLEDLITEIDAHSHTKECI